MWRFYLSREAPPIGASCLFNYIKDLSAVTNLILIYFKKGLYLADSGTQLPADRRAEIFIENNKLETQVYCVRLLNWRWRISKMGKLI